MELVIVPIFFSIVAIVAEIAVSILFGESPNIGLLVTALFYTWMTYCFMRLFYGC